MKNRIRLLLCLLIFSACSAEEFSPGDAWVRIIDHPHAGAEFHPLGLTRSGSGYLVWGAMGEWTPTAVWLNANGEPGQYWVAGPDMVAPVQGVVTISGKQLGCVMDPVSLASIIVDLSVPGTVTEVKRFNSLMYPLAISESSTGELLLLGFNRFERKSVLAVLDGQLEILRQRSFANYQEIDELLLDHMQFRKRYPVMVGETGNQKFYINAFINYSFSLAVLNRETLNQEALYQGTQYKGGVSGFYALGGNRAMMGRFLHDQTYWIAGAELGSGIYVSQDLGGQAQYGWKTGNPIFMMSYIIDNKMFVLRGLSMNDGKLEISVISGETGAVIGARQLGGMQPLEIAAMLPDASGSLDVLAHITLQGGIGRMALFRLAPWEMRKLCGLEE